MEGAVALRLVHDADKPAEDHSATLNEVVRQFETAEQDTTEARGLAERDRDYYDEKQLTPEEISTLESRNQPVVISNRIKRKVNALLGMEKMQRKDPRAFPRNPDDEAAARAATDGIRYVCDSSRWDDKRSLAAKELAIEGTCAIMVGVKEIKKGALKGSTSMSPVVDPDIRRIAWDRLYYDPASAEFDFADAAYMGVVVWMDLDDAVQKHPRAKHILEGTWAQGKDSETYDDKPKHGLWADYARRRVRLCEHYYLKGGVWMFCIFTRGGFIVEPKESPYLDDDGEPENPISAVSLYVDRDNNRYGEVRTMIGPQDEINKRRSKALHLITQRQVRVSPNVANNPAEVRKELSRADGVFIGEAGDVEVLPTNDMAAGNLQLLQEAKNEIDLLGPNAALAGKNESSMSGRAIMAQQQGGMTEAATYLDCIRVLSLSVYHKVWNRIRQYWKDVRWVRVTDDERNLRFVGFNQPITALQAMATQMGVTKEAMPQLEQAAQAGDQQAAQVLQQLQAFAQDPRSQQIVGVENGVAELDVDIVIDEGMDTPSVAAEQFDTLAKMIPGLGAIGQSPKVIKMLIQASSLRNKDELLEEFEEGPQGPSQEEMMQQQAQAVEQQAQMDAQLEIKKAEIAAAAKIEVAKINAAADLQIAQSKLPIEAMQAGYQQP